nr:MAG TPA: hypothetical protein [Caudoviricetes sp.]
MPPSRTTDSQPPTCDSKGNNRDHRTVEPRPHARSGRGHPRHLAKDRRVNQPHHSRGHIRRGRERLQRRRTRGPAADRRTPDLL